MMIYFAHPIDFAHDNLELEIMMNDVVQALGASGAAWYDPAQPFGNAMQDPVAAGAINTYALRKCAGLIALLPPGVPSVGTPMEIQQAVDLGLPVAVLGGFGSMQLLSMPVRLFDWQDSINAIKWLIEQVRIQDAGVESGDALGALKWTGDPECAPRRPYTGDAGWDLVVSQDTRVYVDGFVDVPLGISVELPPDTWAMLTGRSSTLRKRGLLVTQGIIDNGYRGPLYAGCRNLGETPVELVRGERIAQLVPFPLTSETMTPTQVQELSASERGTNGFGSSGA